MIKISSNNPQELSVNPSQILEEAKKHLWQPHKVLLEQRKAFWPGLTLILHSFN